MKCRNCGHRISHNTDEHGKVIIGWHHKNGHGKVKKRDDTGKPMEYAACQCQSAEPVEEVK